MASKPTEKCRYQSRLSPGKYITGAQLLSERMTERIARRDNKDLPTGFWRESKWNKIFRQQASTAARLLKEFPLEAIFRSLRTPEGKKIYSLGAPHLKDLIRREVCKMELERKTLQEPSPLNIAESDDAPRQPFEFKKSTLSRLRDL